MFIQLVVYMVTTVFYGHFRFSESPAKTYAATAARHSIDIKADAIAPSLR